MMDRQHVTANRGNEWTPNPNVMDNQKNGNKQINKRDFGQMCSFSRISLIVKSVTNF